MEEQMPSWPTLRCRAAEVETDSAGFRVSGRQLGRSWLVLAILLLLREECYKVLRSYSAHVRST